MVSTTQVMHRARRTVSRSGFLLSPLTGAAALLGRRSIVAAVAVRLTELTGAGGCAAKYSAARLEELLRGFVPPEAENLLVGLAPADDAAVYRLDDERALVFTLYFFPPVVDDPADFGAIAATNALNDVFAMGGKPLLALSIAEFPEDLPLETVGAILEAAAEQVRAAGALLAGGHTLRADEPKYGLAVVGTVRPDALWTKSPRTLTANCRSKNFVESCSTGPAIPIPAELTRTSRPPARSRCSATSRSQSSSRDTSATTPCTPRSAAAASTFSGRRDEIVRS